MTTYRKDCDCKGASGTNRLITKIEQRGHALYSVVIFYPQPSCCVCDKPWVLMDSPQPPADSPQTDAPQATN